MDYLIIAFRTIVSYAILIIALRFMGKREIGQLNLFDLIILLSIADVMIISIEDYKSNFLFVLLPVVILTLLQKIAAVLLLKNSKIRNIVDGKPSIIILDGVVRIEEMKRLSYNMDDLLLQLRIQNIFKLDDVGLAILETNGKLSAFKKMDLREKYPLPIIISGFFDQNLISIYNINIDYVVSVLGNNHIAIKDVLCCYYDENYLLVYTIRQQKIKIKLS